MFSSTYIPVDLGGVAISRQVFGHADSDLYAIVLIFALSLCAHANSIPPARNGRRNYKPQSGGVAYGYGTAVDSAGNIYVDGRSIKCCGG